MSIATNKFKKQLLESILTDMEDSDNNYYVGVAKSDAWNETDTVPAEVNSELDVRSFRANMQSVKRVSDFSFVTDRNDWDSGETYRAWSDAVDLDDIDNFFVKTDNNSVYICLEQAIDSSGLSVPSTVNPQTVVGTSTKSKRTSDGYVWKYAYTISAVRASKFMTTSYIPVDKITTASTTNEILQLAAQDSAVAGSIVGYRVVNAGAGYSDPQAVIHGDGTQAEALITYDPVAGSIIKVDVADSSDGTQKIGSGYNNANVTITGDSNATVTAIVYPIISTNGIGYDPRDDINANSGMFNVKIIGDDDTGWSVKNDFRQIGIIRNPKKTNDSDFSDAAANTLPWLNISAQSGEFSTDTFIRGTTSNAAAYVDFATTDKVYYHQNENTGYTSFQSAETVQDSDDAATNYATISSDSDADFDRFSGEVLYLENRAPILRDSEQTENIKIIIQL